MNIGEANAAQALLRWAIEQPAPGEGVREAALQLADRAHQKLGAGITPASVHAAWSETPEEKQ